MQPFICSFLHTNDLNSKKLPQIWNMRPPDYLLFHVHISYMVCELLADYKATAVSKLPQWSNLTSDLKSVTPITYLSMCIHCLYGMDPLGSLQGHNSHETASEVKSGLRFEIRFEYISNLSRKMSWIVKKWLTETDVAV